ncbi:MAG: hypothetical protein AVDCRST_MAG96-2515, partial [uncultured Segetibacter sp.]
PTWQHFLRVLAPSACPVGESLGGREWKPKLCSSGQTFFSLKYEKSDKI